MKRKLLSAFAALAALALASCSMDNTSESDEKNAAYITIGLDEASRTALPAVSGAEDFDRFTLTGTTAAENAVAVNKTWETDDTSTAYAKMTGANIAVSAGASYSFTLTATKGGATWQGTAQKTIGSGANPLSFTLALNELSTAGSGSLSVTLGVPTVVKAVEAALKTMDEAETLTPEGALLTFEEHKATYSAENIAAGNYVLVFTLWGDTEKTLKLAEWREYAGITDGVQSISSPVIESAEDLKSIQTVTFKTDSDTTFAVVTGGSTVTKPADPTKDSTETTSYSFAGWYTSADGGTTLSDTAFDFNTAITADITLYAKWKIAGSISYETAIVDKQNGDSNFTNNLTKTGDGTVSYTSSKSGVAIVDETNGEVTIRGAGITTITATVADSDTYTYATNTASYKLLVFRAGKDEVSAGDIAVSSDGGSTLKYVAYDYDLYNLNDYSGSGYEAIGVCVNTEFMIYYEYEWLTYAEAMPEYPQTPDGWTMPTNAQLETIFSNYQILGISARVAGSSDSSLYAKEAWSSERSTNGYPYYYAMAYGRAFVSTGDPSECIVILVRDLEVTPTTYIGSKAPSEAKAVGDIVFTDGSATPYASDLTLTDDQKAKAIAVIFYVGTELNSDDAEGNADTTTSRTLGVGLAHNKSSLAWCTNSANAYSKNITTIQCPASGSAGALTFTGDKDGSDNLSQIGTFLASNGITDDTATEANYPAFYFAKNYASQKIGSESESRIAAGSDYASDWYLPTIAELFQIWKSKETVDAASQLCGGSQFGTGVYWSSSQFASRYNVAYVLNFSNGYRDSGSKHLTSLSVCAVRAFN
ncbi:MAG: InlB B-repeat-containing protein [Treponema sp.]|nr:InlB B-repeat-containing protein [Treponema sp.]